MNNNGAKVNKELIIHNLSFLIHFFSFMMAEALVNERGAQLLGSYSVNSVYAMGILFTGLGYASFSMGRRVVKTQRGRKALVFVISLLCVLSSYIFITNNNVTLFYIGAFTTLACFGHIGGCIYYCHAMIYKDRSNLGKISGACMALAIVLQTVLNLVPSYELIFSVGMILSIVLCLLFIFTSSRDWIFENPLPFSKENKTDKKYALLLISAVVLMTIVLGITDSVITFLDASGEIGIYYGVRFFYAIGLVAAGVTADYGERKYLGLVTLCFILISSVSTILINSTMAVYIGVSLMYVSSGFYVMYLSIMFWDFAPKTKCPELWAGMGRIARCLSLSLLIKPVFALYEKTGAVGLTIADCLFSVLAFLVMMPEIINALGKGNVKEKNADPNERFGSFSKQYSLTPREQEVLERLITTDDGVQEIADKLFISRRVLQRYIASIYEKTGVKSRIGLFQIYTKYEV